MKKVLFFLLLLNQMASAQLFTNTHELGSTIVPTVEAISDIDNDNDIDVLYVSGKDIYISRNNGNEKFINESFLVTNATVVPEIFANDIDNDGDDDVLMVLEDQKLVWYENSSFGLLNTMKVIDSTINNVRSPKVLDIDNDGDKDIVAMTNSNLIWYENIGNTEFSVEKVISPNFTNSFHITDFDGDGVKDVLTTSLTSKVVSWYKNLGGNVFSSENILLSNVNSISAKAVDIDLDGLLDIVSLNTNPDKVVWYKNLTGTAFSVEKMINGANDPNDLQVFDIDGDGDGDLVVNTGNAVVIYENVGNNGFNSSVICSDLSNAISSKLLDIDNDGTLDLVASFSDKICYVENFRSIGVKPKSFQQLAGRVRYIHKINSTDLNGDGSEDILFVQSGYGVNSTFGRLGWMENDGNGAFYNLKFIDLDVNKSGTITSADVDGDGLIDVLCALPYANKVCWYKNLGNDRFSSSKIIGGYSRSANRIFADDFDNDGDKDVLLTIQNFGEDPKLVWFENMGQGVLSSNYSEIHAFSSTIDDLIFSDIDNDGDQDFVSCKTYSDIIWCENLGDGTFSSENVVSSNMSSPEVIVSTDINNDGHLDIVSACNYDDQLYWHKNLGNGSFSNKQVISLNMNVTKAICAADVNNDGNMDVISAERNSSIVSWHRNDGLGNFFPKENITQISSPVALSAGDYNGDGVIDVVSGSGPTGSGDLEWYESSAPCSRVFVKKKICVGSSYFFDGQNQTQSGIYVDTLQSNMGCDSIVNLDLFVGNILLDSVYHEICTGGTYIFNDMQLNQAGIYRDTLMASGGCDSIVVLMLSIISAPVTSISDSYCAGGEYNFYGNSLTHGGVFQHILPSSNGCDSIISLTLTEISAPITSIVDSFCFGGSYQFNGMSLINSGTYYDTLQTAVGCDSIVQLNLTEIQASVTTISGELCTGGSYDFNGISLYGPGTYYDTLQTIIGCDSIVVLTLTQVLAITPTISISADPGVNIAVGTQVIFTATALPISSGIFSYQWQVNGVDVPGVNSPSFTSSNLNNNDVVTCVFTTDLACVTSVSVISNSLIMNVVQPISNDECSGAILLGQNINCAITNGITIGASQSMSPLNCSGYIGKSDDDVWFSFVAASSDPVIEVVGIGNFDAVVDLRTGNCNGLNIDCSDAAGPGVKEVINAQNLVIGQKYLIRVYDFAENAGGFTICVHGNSTSIREYNATTFTLYPNPSKGILSLKFESVASREIQVVSAIGEIIYQDKINEQEAVILLENQPKGLYHVRVITKDKVEVSPVVIE